MGISRCRSRVLICRDIYFRALHLFTAFFPDKALSNPLARVVAGCLAPRAGRWRGAGKGGLSRHWRLCQSTSGEN